MSKYQQGQYLIENKEKYVGNKPPLWQCVINTNMPTFLDNKYTKLYYKIIQSAKIHPYDGYTEKHHIVPKSLGGNNATSNLVLLSARQHFICHRLLTKMTQGKDKSKMVHAVWSFVRTSKNQQRQMITSRTYETLRLEKSKIMSETFSGKNNPMYGKTPSAETIAKISKALTGQKKSKETKQKMKDAWASRDRTVSAEVKEKISKSLTGREASEETKKKMSTTRKGVNPTWTQIEWTCDHCNKRGTGKSNYNRWHGDNCKEYK